MTEHGRKPVIGRSLEEAKAAANALANAGARAMDAAGLAADFAGCAGCERVRKARAGAHPFFIAELQESLVFVHDDQRYTGHCVLFLKSHGEHLHQLPVAVQSRLAEDVAEVAAAVAAIHQPKRLNYECLGNVLAHIHWHVIPRYDWDPDPKNVIWVRPVAERATGADPVAVAALVAKMRERLAAQTGKAT